MSEGRPSVDEKGYLSQGEVYDNLTSDKLKEIVAAVENQQTFTPSGIHINYGESEYMMGGYNLSYEHTENGQVFPTPVLGAPIFPPHREAWIWGYQNGWDDARSEEKEE